MRADDGRRLGHAVVVRGDGASAHVRVIADRCVANVAEVRHLAALTDSGVLGLDESADLAVRFEHSVRPEVGERTDGCPRTNHSQSAIGARNSRTLPNLTVGERGVGPDDGIALYRCRALELRARQQLDVFADGDAQVDPGARRVVNGDAVELVAAHDERVHAQCRFTQLHAIVDARDDPRGASGHGCDGGAGLSEEGDYIRQIFLVL